MTRASVIPDTNSRMKNKTGGLAAARFLLLVDSLNYGVTQIALPGVLTKPPPPVPTVFDAAPLPAVPVF